MMHDELRRCLDDFVSGALPEAERSEVESHLRTCTDCAADVQALQALLAAARRLPEAVEPRRDLWPAIEARLASAPRLAAPTLQRSQARARRWPGRWALAAGVAALAALGGWWSLQRRGSAADSGPAVASPDVFSTVVSGLELECMGTGQLLQASFRARDDSAVSDAMTAVAAGLTQALPIVDRSIAEVQAALASHPGDPDLQRMLAARYEQKLALLQATLQRVEGA